MRAAKRYEAKMLQGIDEPETVEAEAGAILEAELADNIHFMRRFAESIGRRSR